MNRKKTKGEIMKKLTEKDIRELAKNKDKRKLAFIDHVGALVHELTARELLAFAQDFTDVTDECFFDSEDEIYFLDEYQISQAAKLRVY
jgi:ABC-type transport system involved in cytochrome c biogenesis ATPase subunit